MDILDNLELPASQRGGGARGSKFLTDEQAELLGKLGLNQGFIISLMELGDVKDPAKRQRYATDYRVKEWAKVDGKGKTFKVAILEGKGIAVKLVAIKAPVVAAPAAEVAAEKPAADAAKPAKADKKAAA